jgi:hypothetical protein
MPRVPEYQEIGQATRPMRVAQMPQATPVEFGGGVAAGLQDVGHALLAGAVMKQRAKARQEEEAERQKRYDDQVASVAAEAEATRAGLQLLYGDPFNPASPGMIGMKGQQAVAALPAVVDAIDKVYDDQLGKLTNQEQKNLFLSRTMADRLNNHRQAQIHVRAELDAMTSAAYKSRKETFLQGYALADATARPALLDPMIQLTVEESRRAGEPDEVLKRRLYELREDAHIAAMHNYVAQGQYQAGEAYLTMAGDEMSADVRGKFQKALEPIQQATEAEAKAREILAASTDDLGKIDGIKAATMVNDLPPGQLVHDVRPLVEHQVRLQNENERGAVDELVRQAGAVLEQTGSLGNVPKALRSAIINRAPDAWLGLERAQHEKARWGKEKADETEGTALFYDALNLSVDNPETFMDPKKTPLHTLYVGKMPARLLLQLEERQARLRASAEAGALDYSLMNDAKIVDYYAVKAGVIPRKVPGRRAPWKTTEAANYQALWDAVKEDMDAIRAEGRKPRREDVDKSAQAHTQKILMEKPGWFGRKSWQESFVFEAPAGAPTQAIIPPSERVLILNGLRQAGEEPTDERIQEVWAYQEAKRRGAPPAGALAVPEMAPEPAEEEAP